MPTRGPAAQSSAGRAGLVFVVLIAAIGALAAWWYFAPDSLPAMARTALPASPKANPTLYKWRDDKGRWNVTDTPPTGRPYQTLQYDPRTNVVPSVVPPPPAN
ncbi:MAG TPA: DUF4124 domain-containing protein [Rudaea sp.]